MNWIKAFVRAVLQISGLLLAVVAFGAAWMGFIWTLVHHPFIIIALVVIAVIAAVTYQNKKLYDEGTIH